MKNFDKTEKIQAWFNSHKPEENMLWSKSWMEHNVFIRDNIVEMLSDKVAEVVGTHYSKSIECPVIKTYYKGVEVLWQYNFYNWQIMVKSNKDLELTDLDYIGADADYFFYQGIPTEYQFKPYSKDNKKEFAISTVFSKYCVFAFAVELKKAIDRAKKHYWLCKY